MCALICAPPIRPAVVTTLAAVNPSASDLTALTAYPALHQLGPGLAASLTQDDWQALTGLEKLAVLSLNTTELADLAAAAVALQGVENVTLLAGREKADLRAVLTAFSALKWLQVHDADEIDLAPLAPHPRLRRVTTTSSTWRILNADRLPDTIEVNPRLATTSEA
jgi:hypothetical protein